MACRAQISTLTMVTDVIILVSAILVIPYLIYIAYCVIADYLRRRPITILWRFMRLELEAARGRHSESNILKSGLPTQEETPQIPKEPMDTSEEITKTSAGVQKISDTSDDAKKATKNLRERLGKDINNKIMSMSCALRNGTYKMTWPNISTISNELPTSAPPEIANLAKRVDDFERRHLLSPERRKWWSAKIEEIKASRKRLDNIIIEHKLHPHSTPELPADSTITAHSESSDPATGASAEDENIYRTLDGKSVSLLDFKKSYVSPMGNQCVWRAYAKAIFNDENRYKEIKERVCRLLLLYCGQDPNQFDYDVFRGTIQYLVNYFNGGQISQLGTYERFLGANYFKNREGLRQLVQHVSILIGQYSGEEKFAEWKTIEEICDNSTYCECLGRDPEFDRIALQLAAIQDEVLAVGAATDDAIDFNTWNKIIGLTAEQICPDPCNVAVQAESIDNLFAGLGIVTPPKKPLDRLANTSLRILWNVAEMLRNNTSPTFNSNNVAPIIAFLFDCTVTTYDQATKEAKTYTPDMIEIPEEHPHFEEIMSMRERLCPEVNIWAAGAPGCMGHCWALFKR